MASSLAIADQYRAAAQAKWETGLARLQQLSQARAQYQLVQQQQIMKEQRRQEKIARSQQGKQNLMNWVGLGIQGAGAIGSFAAAPFTGGATLAPAVAMTAGALQTYGAMRRPEMSRPTPSVSPVPSPYSSMALEAAPVSVPRAYDDLYGYSAG